MTTFSKPTMQLTVNDWPYGSKRTTATFTIEQTKRGERVSRVTVNPKNGRVNKPKTTTYATKVRIVEGDDSKTYIAELTQFGHITIMESNLQYQHAVYHVNDDSYQDVLALFSDN